MSPVSRSRCSGIVFGNRGGETISPKDLAAITLPFVGKIDDAPSDVIKIAGLRFVWHAETTIAEFVRTITANALFVCSILNRFSKSKWLVPRT